MKTIKGVVGESSLTLTYEGRTINIQKATDNILFEEFKDLIKEGRQDAIIGKFLSVKKKIEKYTNRNFFVKSGALYLKGDEERIPKALANKLVELEDKGEDFMPLVRFWKNLKKNPSKESREQLYGFIESNNIPITNLGMLVTEKGVKQKSGAPVGTLVDCRTGSVDNSIGMSVSMPREGVDSDPNRTCSHGLHVGAPDYVRKFYGGNIIVTCIVDPMDVVAVPNDYNNTKMWVSRYTVVGYSNKTLDKPVYKMEDFITKPLKEDSEKMEEISSSTLNEVSSHLTGDNSQVKSEVFSLKVKDNKKDIEKYIKEFSKMTAREVLTMVRQEYNISLPHNPKSKKAIVKKAALLKVRDEEIKS